MKSKMANVNLPISIILNVDRIANRVKKAVIVGLDKKKTNMILLYAVYRRQTLDSKIQIG